MGTRLEFLALLGVLLATASYADPCPDRQSGTLPISPKALIEWAGSSMVGVEYLAPGTAPGQPWFTIDLKASTEPGAHVETHVALDPNLSTSSDDLKLAYALYSESLKSSSGVDLYDYKVFIRNKTSESDFNAKVALLSLFADQLAQVTDPALQSTQPSPEKAFRILTAHAQKTPYLHEFLSTLDEIATALGLDRVKSADQPPLPVIAAFRDRKTGKLVLISSNQKFVSANLDLKRIKRIMLGETMHAPGSGAWNQFLYPLQFDGSNGSSVVTSHPDIHVEDSAPSAVGTLSSMFYKNQYGTQFSVLQNTPDARSSSPNLYLQQLSIGEDIDRSGDLGEHLNYDFSASGHLAQSQNGSSFSHAWDTDFSGQIGVGDHTSFTVESQGDNSRRMPFQIVSIKSELNQSDNLGVSVTNVFLPAPTDDSQHPGYHHTEFGVHNKVKLAGGKIELGEESNFFTRSTGGFGFYGKSYITVKSQRYGVFWFQGTYGLDPTVIVPLYTLPPSSLGMDFRWEKKVISGKVLDIGFEYRHEDATYHLMSDPTFGLGYEQTPRLGFEFKFTW